MEAGIGSTDSPGAFCPLNSYTTVYTKSPILAAFPVPVASSVEARARSAIDPGSVYNVLDPAVAFVGRMRDAYFERPKSV